MCVAGSGPLPSRGRRASGAQAEDERALEWPSCQPARWDARTSEEEAWDIGRGRRLGGPTDPFGDGTVQQRWEAASLDDLAEGLGRMAFTLRFTLSHPDLHTTIVGTTNPDHLAQNVEAARAGPLPDDVYEEAKRRLATAGAQPE